MRLIDADALKDKARELIPNYHASVVMNLFDLIDNLADNMPTIEALQGRKAGEWIPVSERMPEEKKQVLVCDAYGFIYTAEYEVSSDGEPRWYESVEYRLMDDVMAWMPLPEPWKGEEDE